MKRLIRKSTMKKQAAYISSDFDYFLTKSGDVIGFGCRIVNNKPWYQVYHEGLYNCSSYYDGPDYDKANQMYKDLLTAFKGITSTEKFVINQIDVNEKINNVQEEKDRDTYNFNKLKSKPLFLGVEHNDF